MHGNCLDYPLQKWFDFRVPPTSISSNYIVKSLEANEYIPSRPTAKLIWLGAKPELNVVTRTKKGNHWEMAEINFQTVKETVTIRVDKQKGEWLVKLLESLSNNRKHLTIQQVRDDYEKNGLEDFELFWENKPVNTLYKVGLLVL
jgi:hypothetical protein